MTKEETRREREKRRSEDLHVLEELYCSQEGHILNKNASKKYGLNYCAICKKQWLWWNREEDILYIAKGRRREVDASERRVQESSSGQADEEA